MRYPEVSGRVIPWHGACPTRVLRASGGYKSPGQGPFGGEFESLPRSALQDRVGEVLGRSLVRAPASARLLADIALR